MDNDKGTVQQMPVFVCTNNDAGDGQPCVWFERPRVAAVTTERISVGQGLFLVPTVRCECGSYLRDRGGPSQ